ncbi:MAG TPA: CopG family transcriptional regulator [Jatrophihabitans sp.]|nr:CopG family transcriptional regulator [Jatrophihabitans sp.]
MSIYLPDELAERLKHVEDTTASAVIQDALRRHFGTAGKLAGPVWAQPPSEADKLVFAATLKLRDEAIAEYQAGYRAALERLPDLSLATLNSFARRQFDLHKWLDDWNDPRQPKWMWKIAEDVGSIANPLGYDEFSFRKTSAYEHGYAAGLRAAYELIDRGEADSAAPIETDDPSGGGDIRDQA